MQVKIYSLRPVVHVSKRPRMRFTAECTAQCEKWTGRRRLTFKRCQASCPTIIVSSSSPHQEMAAFVPIPLREVKVGHKARRERMAEEAVEVLDFYYRSAK